MDVDRRVARRYEVTDEEERLWQPGRGDLVRLRTWDIFERYLPPPPGRLLDVGGGPGTHAAHLAGRGYDVVLVDPVPRHVTLAAQRAGGPGQPRFDVLTGVAGALPTGDTSADVVALMGPLYHLVDRADRMAALVEARRALRPGGRVLAEVIARHAWVLDASAKQRLTEPGIWESFTRSVETGFSQDPDDCPDGGFWAYFHRIEELRDELTDAGFTAVELVAVEGFAWLLGDLEDRMRDPAPLLRAVRMTETEPSMLGCSAHVIGIGTRP